MLRSLDCSLERWSLLVTALPESSEAEGFEAAELRWSELWEASGVRMSSNSSSYCRRSSISVIIASRRSI